MGPWPLEQRPPLSLPQSTSSVLLLLLLPLLGPTGRTAAQRCPQPCVCDNARRHVACRHRNLTEVPPAIPEVSGVRGGDLPLPGWEDTWRVTFLSDLSHSVRWQ